jgi:hypothetical protein
MRLVLVIIMVVVITLWIGYYDAEQYQLFERSAGNI